jgi:hypothetical protein
MDSHDTNFIDTGLTQSNLGSKPQFTHLRQVQVRLQLQPHYGLHNYSQTCPCGHLYENWYLYVTKKR